MKNKLYYLIKYSLYKKLKTKSFVIANIILLILMVGLTNIDKIIAYFGGEFQIEREIAIIDHTQTTYPFIEYELNKYKEELKGITEYRVIEYEVEEEDKIREELKKTNNMLIVIEEDSDNYIKAKIVANKIDNQILYQTIVGALNNTKITVALNLTNIALEELNKIYSPITIDQESLSEAKENGTELIMGTVFPTLILPMFILIIFVIQMIGMEITEEKATKGMEIIISNVRADIHFYSKIIAANTFVICQALLLIGYSSLGLLLRKLSSGGSGLVGTFGLELTRLWNELVASGVAAQFLYIIPLTLILFLLTILLYSLIAGILASITVNVEDYQQIQIPISILLLTSYYLSLLAGAFQGAKIIKIIGYLPFFSALLAPSLLIIGEMSIMDVFIAIGLLGVVIYLIIKFGIKIYKAGILNYSSEKVWQRMTKVIKNRDV